MNILLIIAGVGLILAAAFILKGKKKQADRNARYRVAPRPPLKLDRVSGLGRSRSSRERGPLLPRPRSGSPAAPILLGAVLMVLSLWLAAAYLRPSAESSEAGGAAVGTASPPPPSPQVGTLAGRLSTPEPAAVPLPAPPAPPAPPPAPPVAPEEADVTRAAALAQAAAGQIGGDSALNQVGLMPTRQAASAAPAPPALTPAPKPGPSPGPAAAEARTVAPDPAAKPPSTSTQTSPAPSPANSSLVRVLAGPPPVQTGAPAGVGTSRNGILSNNEGFTVHLGSFVDQSNAEKFRAKLAAAGEAAAISEISMDGRRWYRVLSGRFDTRAAADAHGRNLRRRGLIDDTGPFIVKPINTAEN